MDGDISIRKAEISDIGRIKEILVSAWKEYEIAVPENFSASDIDSIKVENNRERVFVLQKADAVIGFVVLRPINTDLIELKRLYLAASERGRRLGAHLLNWAIDFAKRKNYKSIRLETTSRFKRAVSLYQKHGFTVLKEVETAPGHDLALQKDLGPVSPAGADCDDCLKQEEMHSKPIPGGRR